MARSMKVGKRRKSKSINEEMGKSVNKRVIANIKALIHWHN